jgi:membrane fusion protein, copper/silver efflux system
MTEANRKHINMNAVKLIIALAMIVAAPGLLMGCSDADHHPQGAADAPPQGPADEARQESQDPVGRVVLANFELVDALADDEPERARTAARQALEQVEALPAEVEPEQSRQVMRDALQQVIDADSIAQMRRHFEPFSDELTRNVQATGTGDVAPVYRAMCPMVEGRRAYWLQPHRQITNPYWGERMYRCGEITETLVQPQQGDPHERPQ